MVSILSLSTLHLPYLEQVPSIVVKDPAWNEQEDEDVLLDCGALCSSVSSFQAGWSSFSFILSIGIKAAGMLR